MKRYSVASVFLGMFAAWLAQPITGQEKESARRTWTDCAGKYTVEGDFVEFKEGHVHLRKQNGEVVSVPLERLSLADQRYVKRMLASPEDVPDSARRTISCRLQYLTISPDGRTLASVGTSPDDHWKSELKLWSAATGRPLATLKNYFGSSSDWGQRYAAFTSDGKMFVGQARGPANPTGVLRHTVTPGFWDVRTGHMLQINTPRLLITNPPLRSETPFWHFDSETNQIRRPEMVSFGLDAQGFVIHGFSHERPGRRTALSPDGTAYAIVKGDGESIMLGDLDAKPRTTLQSAGSVGTLSFSPDGKLLVIARHEKAIEVWDFETGRKRHTIEYDSALRHHSPYSGIVVISADSKTLVSFAGGETELWDLETGRKRGAVAGRPRVGCLALSADSRILALGSEHELDFSIRLFKVKTANELGSLKGHTAVVRAVFVLPDRKTLISGSEDGTIRWWDIAAVEDMLRDEVDIP